MSYWHPAASNWISRGILIFSPAPDVFPACQEWRKTNWEEVESRTCQLSPKFLQQKFPLWMLNDAKCPPLFQACHLCFLLSGCTENFLLHPPLSPHRCLIVGSAEADWIIEQSTEESQSHWLSGCRRGLMLDTRLQNQPEKATSVSSIFTISSAHRLRGAAACMELQESRVKINKAVPTAFKTKSQPRKEIEWTFDSFIIVVDASEWPGDPWSYCSREQFGPKWRARPNAKILPEPRVGPVLHDYMHQSI